MFAWALLGTLVLNVFGTLVPFYSMAVYDRVIPNNALGTRVRHQSDVSG